MAKDLVDDILDEMDPPETARKKAFDEGDDDDEGGDDSMALEAMEEFISLTSSGDASGALAALRELVKDHC